MSSRRRTFSDHVRQTLPFVARQTWQRAETASRLRHVASESGNYRAAAALSCVKIEAVSRTIEIVPFACDVDIDFVHGLPYQSVHFGLNGHKLHIPIHVRLPKEPGGR